MLKLSNLSAKTIKEVSQSITHNGVVFKVTFGAGLYTAVSAKGEISACTLALLKTYIKNDDYFVIFEEVSKLIEPTVFKVKSVTKAQAKKAFDSGLEISTKIKNLKPVSFLKGDTVIPFDARVLGYYEPTDYILFYAPVAVVQKPVIAPTILEVLTRYDIGYNSELDGPYNDFLNKVVVAYNMINNTDHDPSTTVMLYNNRGLLVTDSYKLMTNYKAA